MSRLPKRLVIGISGASGMIYAVRLLQALPADYEINLIVSDVAKKIMKSEMNWDCDSEPLPEFIKRKYKRPLLADKIIIQPQNNLYASIASGSFKVDGMVICPCSMKTLAGVANGYADTLIERAADVNLKENRPLILLVRETPFNRIHLENMLKSHDAGATIVPANPAFYHNPKTIEDLVDFVVARILNLLNIEQNLFKGWRETD